MMNRLCGALLLIFGCGGIGSTMVHLYRREVVMLRQMYCFVENITCDLQYRLTPLPQLLRNEESALSGNLRRLMQDFVTELESQIAPNAAICLEASLARYPEIPQSIVKVLQELGNSFGRFDLQGQLKCLEATQLACKKELTHMEDRQLDYSRCCHAYSLGAGVILALLFI